MVSGFCHFTKLWLTQSATLVPPGQCAAKQPLTKSTGLYRSLSLNWTSTTGVETNSQIGLLRPCGVVVTVRKWNWNGRLTGSRGFCNLYCHHISVTLCETALSLVVNQGDYVNNLTFYQMHPTYLVPKATTGWLSNLMLGQWEINILYRFHQLYHALSEHVSTWDLGLGFICLYLYLEFPQYTFVCTFKDRSVVSGSSHCL